MNLFIMYQAIREEKRLSIDIFFECLGKKWAVSKTFAVCCRVFDACDLKEDVEEIINSDEIQIVIQMLNEM